MASPKELGGHATTETNPEQLFAAGYSACFNSALTLILKKSGVKEIDPEVQCTAMLLVDEADSGVKSAAELEVRLYGIDQQSAEKYVELAHNYCPYSKALKDSIDIELTVIAD